jgi:hypothetical protein
MKVGGKWEKDRKSAVSTWEKGRKRLVVWFQALSNVLEWIAWIIIAIFYRWRVILL